MTDNLHVNVDLCENNSTTEKLRKDSGVDVMPLIEEVTVMKTEVKEESCDFDTSVEDMVFVTVKEEYVSSPENNFVKENLELAKSTEQSLNENHDVGNYEFKEAYLGGNKYKCELCHSDFDNEMSLKNHYEHCSFANKLSQDLVELKHNNTDERYECAHCMFLTSVRSRFVKHVRIHAKMFKCTYKNCKCIPGQEEYCVCDTCEFAAVDRSNLNQHILVRHSAEPKKYKCIDCNYATHTKKSLVEHSRIHTNDRPFKCTYKNCKCTPEQEKFCVCAMCKYAAIAKSHLNQHILARHSTEPKKYKCVYCNYATQRKTSLVLHIHTHTKEKQFKCTYKNCKCTPGQEEFCECDICEYASIDKKCLQRHILVKHSTESKKHKCGDCNYTAYRRADLTQHMRTHTNDKPYKCIYKECECTPEQKELCQCNTCEYAATKKSHLNRHVLMRHSEEPKKYKCKDCDYASHLKASLAIHNRIHTNDRPFKCTYKNCKCIPENEAVCRCDTCEYAAVQINTLKMHILMRHERKPKKYECKDCNYATHMKGNLVAHTRTHMKDRPLVWHI